MTLAAFRRLLPKQRIELTLEAGIPLLRRPWAEGGSQLFFVPTSSTGIFVELRHETRLQVIVLINSFTTTAELEKYLDLITLPRYFN